MSRRTATRLVLPRVTMALLTTLLALVSGLARAQEQEPDTPPLAANQRPDRCEPNDSSRGPCVLQLDAVEGPFTLLPDGEHDYYSVDLGAEPGLALAVTVRGTVGLDLITTISRAGAPDTLATIASPAISATLDADLTGWLIIRVENRSPQLAAGESYVVELRRVLPPSPSPAADAERQHISQEPDQLENNWSPATAAPIGVGVVYDLNFVCPVVWGCAGGDHDYLAVPVKAGVAYLLATFDLGPGVDTVIDVFWGSGEAPTATSDDFAPGRGLLSALRWVAPADGVAVIRIGPRAGALSAIVLEERADAYRFVVALAASDLGEQVEERVRAQSETPAAEASSAVGRSSESDATGPMTTTAQIVSDAPRGPAVVRVSSTALREVPGQSGAAIQQLAGDSAVTLLGQSSGAWVRVQPESGVVPGWVYGPDLQAVASAPPLPTEPNESSGADAVQSETATPAPLPQVRALEPAPLPPVPSPEPHVPLDLTVIVRSAGRTSAPTPRAGRSTPTLTEGDGVANVRIQLVTVFGDVLAEAITPASGQVTLRRDLPPSVAVFVRAPALGAQAAVDRAQQTMTLSIPVGELP